MKPTISQRIRVFIDRHKAGVFCSILVTGVAAVIGIDIYRRHAKSSIESPELLNPNSEPETDPEEPEIESECEEKATDVPEKTAYDKAAELLATLWLCDDVLIEEEHPKAVEQATALIGLMPDPANILLDILNRADENHYLPQEDFFNLQGMTEYLTRYLAEKEDRVSDFENRFPWL